MNLAAVAACVALLPRLPQDEAASVLNSILSLALVLASTAWIFAIVAWARDVYQEFDLGALLALALWASALGSFFTVNYVDGTTAGSVLTP